MKNRHFSFMLLSIGLVVGFSGCPLLMPVRVPDVVGMTQLAAESAISGRSLTVGTVTESFHPSAPVGEVTGQSPAAGTVVDYGSAVDLTVSKGPESVTVPDVVGMTGAEAGEALAAVGLTVGTVTESFHPSAPEGEVLGQSPTAGTVVSPGSAVDLTVSKGPELVAVPNVVGMAQAAAGVEIVAAGLAVGTVGEAYHPSVPVGEVIGQNPVSGTMVLPGSAVDLTVSKGPEPVAVPNVVGLTQAAATSALTGAGLAVGTVTEVFHASVPAGQVTSQNPAAGASVSPGSSVNLTVSKGPEPVAVPDVVGMLPPEAAAALATAGFTAGSQTDQYHHSVTAGLVCRQNPAAGTMAVPGSAVNLGVSRGPYLVSIEELQKIGNDPDYPLDATFYLMNAIDATATAGWNSGAGFVPVGTEAAPFTGTLDGDGYTITGLHISRPASDHTGLVGYAGDGCVLRNLTLADCSVEGGSFAGALAGYAGNVTVEGCDSGGSVSGASQVGGLLGRAGGTVTGCGSSVVVSGSGMFIGGLIGENTALVSGCDATCNVTAINVSSYCGGLIGYNHDNTVSGCTATGTVSGQAYAGGLVGINMDGDITGCWTNVNLTGGYHAGGLAGSHSSGTVAYSWAKGPVSGISESGGFLGFASGTVHNCYADGAVSGTIHSIGGFIGYNMATVTKCFSYSSVTGSGTTERFGGLVGTHAGGSLSNCHASGTVSCGESAGGLVGRSERPVSQCYARGAVSATNTAGGLVGEITQNTVTESYSSGAVTATTNAGGLVGSSAGTVSTSFWDTQTSGQAASAGGTGMTTAEMKTQATFTGAGWDFNDVWGIVEDTYPYLKNMFD
jgi:beta-lactam-binding protein with PASTA domain